jgi:Calcineurin-like phosphoesterase
MSVLQGLCAAPSAFKQQLVAAWKGESNDDRLFYSTYQNGGWAAQSTIPGNSSVGVALAAVGDVVYAAWKGEQDDERLFFSSFNGTAWSVQQVIPGNSSVGPSLAQFNGKLYAAWKGESFDQRLFFSYYSGNSWAPQQQIPNVASAVGPCIAQFGSSLYAVWRGTDDDQNLYWSAYNGTSWTDQALIGGIGGAGSNIGPSLAVFGGSLYAMWKGLKGDEGLYWASFNGSNWSSQQRVSGIASSIGPATAGTSGVLYAMWKGETGDQRLWFSNFNGSIWSPQATIPGNSGQDPIRFLWIPDVHLERDDTQPGQPYANGIDLCNPPTNPVGDQPTTWTQQCQWINTNQPTYHYQALLCAGDYAALGGGSWDLPTKQQEAWSLGVSVAIQCGKPFLSVSGNHDNEQNTPGWYTYSFDTNIGHDQICNNPWYLGYWNADPLDNGTNSSVPNNYSSKSNQAIAFSVGAQQILVISLEFCPRPNALTWAQGVIAQHPTHDVILLTHWYLDLNGAPFPISEAFNGGVFDGNQPRLAGTSGQLLLQWILTQPRIRLSMCGHVVTAVENGQPTQPNIATSSNQTNSGETTIGIVANYQFTGTGRPDTANPRPCSEVVLMVDIGEASVNVRAFNTTLSQELNSQWGYPLMLS